jgi:plasmid stability protein
MAQLNIRDFDSKLMAKLKVGAAKAGKTLKAHLTDIVRAAVAK